MVFAAEAAIGIGRVRMKPVETDNLDLIARAAAGDLVAYQRFIEQYSPRVYAIAYQMVGDNQDAQDITQEVFIKLHRSLNKFQPTSRFATWLYRVTVNLCIDYQRKNARFRHPSLEDHQAATEIRDHRPTPDTQVEWNELRGEIDRLTGQLTPRQRCVFILRDLQDLTTGEIAGILKCQPSTVRVHLAQARALIKTELTRLYPELERGDDQ